MKLAQFPIQLQQWDTNRRTMQQYSILLLGNSQRIWFLIGLFGLAYPFLGWIFVMLHTIVSITSSNDQTNIVLYGLKCINLPPIISLIRKSHTICECLEAILRVLRCIYVMDIGLIVVGNSDVWGMQCFCSVAFNILETTLQKHCVPKHLNYLPLHWTPLRIRVLDIKPPPQGKLYL